MTVNLTQFPSASNVTDFAGVLTYANTVTAGYFGTVIVFSLSIVVFMVFGLFSKERAFVMASVTALFSSSFFYVLGLVGAPIVMVAVACMVLSAYLLNNQTQYNP